MTSNKPECNNKVCVIMGKKKIRKHQKEPNESSHSSDDDNQTEFAGKCPHVVKSVSLNAVKKALKGSATLGDCQACVNNEPPLSPLASEPYQDLVETTTWLCLQCGNQGCDRYSKHQHALLHYQTPRSDFHSLVINTTTWAVWCYDCDEEIFAESNKKLLECVNFVRKQAGVPKSKSHASPPTTGVSKGTVPITDPEISDPTGVPQNMAVQNLRLPKLESQMPKLAEDKVDNQSKSILSSLPRLKGLSNLGNTCFFNAIMQNLSQTQWLTHLIEMHSQNGAVVSLPGKKRDVDYEAEAEEVSITEQHLDSLDIVLPEGGPLTQALALFFKEMQMPAKNGVISPGHVFGQICKKAPQFRGSKQQDSHELLRHLLDGLRTEEIKRQKSGILRAFNLTEKVDPKTVDEEIKKKVKAYGRQVNHTIVDSIFSGQLISTVLCKECQMSSQVFEPFLDLSLPISEEKPLRPGLQKKLSMEEVALDYNLHKDDKPSRYQEKKAKRQARKDAKKNKGKQKELGVLDGPDVSVTRVSQNSTKAEDTPRTGDEVGNDASETSDADEEDNAESESTVASLRLDKLDSNFVTSPKSDAPLAEGEKGAVTEEESVSESCSKVTEVEAQSAASSEIQSPQTPGGTVVLPFETELCSRMEDLSMFENRAGSCQEEPATHCNTVSQAGDGAGKLRLPPTSENERGKTTESGAEGAITPSVEKEVGDEKGHWTKLQKSRFKQDWIAKSLTTLAPRYMASSHECSILSCLNQFTAPELLTGNNKFGCENCTKLRQEKLDLKGDGKKPEVVYSNASKQLLIFSPPAVLTLHLKRFQQVGYTLRKVNRHVDFPILLDLAPFCSSICLGLPNMSKGQSHVLYSLYGVVQHSGRLASGHYIAFVKVRPKMTEDRLRFLNRKPAGQYEINRLVSEMARKTICENGNSSPANNSNEELKCYTAEPPPGKWYSISDSHVAEVTEENVLKSQAYILLYERIM